MRKCGINGKIVCILKENIKKEAVFMKWYRLFLIILLIAAIGGGVWYCYGLGQQNHVVQEGTLV